MSNDIIEIAAPAGNLETGIYAFQAGAGAVYFGLTQFSARAGAANLSFSDARRLKAYALAHEGRIYAAINTVITEDELPFLLDWVKQLALMEVDGIIIQDLGLAASIRDRFPDVPIHGSTQLGVHNKLGLAAAASLGLSRVVLSRELSIIEIGRLKNEFKTVEREVFVHGALCYGFSGLCLASDLLTGRSGNRGECAQICRSWFEHGKDKGYYFSCLDLDAGELLNALIEAGVVSIKIEGRMKNAAYCFNTTAYYRALLDGDPQKAAYYRDLSTLSFSRPKSKGFLTTAKKSSLVHPSYPSHIGLPGAEVLAVERGQAKIRALRDLNAHDRLMRLPDGPPDRGTTIVVSEFNKNGKKTRNIKKGETAMIRRDGALRPTMVLMKTLSYDMHLKSLSAGGFPEHKKLLPLSVMATDNGLRLGTKILGELIVKSYDAPITPRLSGKPFNQVMLSLFSSSKEYPFGFDRLKPFDGQPPIAQDLFVPPSALKKIRNRFYDDVQDSLQAKTSLPQASADLNAFSHPLPPREQIIYRDGFPFLLEGTNLHADKWPLLNGWRYLSLPPVMFSPDKTIAFLGDQIKKHSLERFAVGLNNVGHLALLKDWARFDNLFFYIDYGLCAANTSTLASIQNMGNVCGAYLWLEANEEKQRLLRESILTLAGEMPPGLRFIDQKKIFPMFISRVCFERSIKDGVCPENCPRDFDYRLKQNRRWFEAKVRNCITYLFEGAKTTRAKSPGE